MSAMSLVPETSYPKVLSKVVERMGDDRRVDGVLLFGSFARSEASGSSDIDLVVVHHGPVPEDLLDEDLSPRLSIGFYSPARLAELPERCPLFANHLAREGLVFQDRTGVLSGVLRRVNPVSASSADRLAALTERRLADVLDDPSFGPSDRLSAAELYALAKQSALLASARAGLYEFNRHRALLWVGETTPQLRSDVENVSALETAWLSNRHTPKATEPVSVSSSLVSSVVRIVQFARGH